MFNRWPFPPKLVPLGSSSNATLNPTPTRYTGRVNPSVIPVIALLIKVRVRPHIALCSFTAEFSTSMDRKLGSGYDNFMYSRRGTEVVPRGPCTAIDSGVTVRVTAGGTGMGFLPMWDTFVLWILTGAVTGDADVLRERIKLPSCTRGIMADGVSPKIGSGCLFLCCAAALVGV